MMNIFKQITDKWDMRYNRYSDILILFDPEIAPLGRDRLYAEDFTNDLIFSYKKDNNKLMRIEIVNASNFLGMDLKNIEKKKIIKKIKELEYA